MQNVERTKCRIDLDGTGIMQNFPQGTDTILKKKRRMDKMSNGHNVEQLIAQNQLRMNVHNVEHSIHRQIGYDIEWTKYRMQMERTYYNVEFLS